MYDHFMLGTRGRRIVKFTGFLVVVVGLGITGLVFWTRHGAGRDSPRIGLSVSDAWYDDLGFHRAAYDIALARAGARVVSLRPHDQADGVDEMVRDLDGILLAGGGDVEPSIYGGEFKMASLVDPERDRFELEVLDAAKRHGLPVVGICRGIQILAVAHGGTLRDLREEKPLAEKHGITLKSMSAHDVTVVEGTCLERIVGSGTFPVNSFHAQAVKDPGSLKVAARSSDGVVEALELPGDRLVLGTQWHPEIMGVLDDTQQAIIEVLVGEARKIRKQRPAAP